LPNLLSKLDSIKQIAKNNNAKILDINYRCNAVIPGVSAVSPAIYATLN